jgi:alternate signal-mediated exported protein
MKKFNMKKTTTAAVAATVGAVLLLGGAGTLAYWSDTETSTNQTISSGNLDLNAITSGQQVWKIQQIADGMKTSSVTVDANTTIVPGDVLTTTVQVPTKLVGTNMKARIDVSDAKVVALDATKVDGLDKKLVVDVQSINGTVLTTVNNVKKTSVDVTPANIPADGNVPVVISVTLPWATDTTTPVASNTIKTALQAVTFSAKYTLTQITAGTTAVTP